MKKLSNEEIFNDPELMEAVGHYIRNQIIDEVYPRLRYEGKSHEDAMIGARREAGIKVKPNTKIGRESYANAMMAKDYRDKQKLLSIASNEKRKAGALIAAILGSGAAGLALADLLNIDNVQADQVSYDESTYM